MSDQPQNGPEDPNAPKDAQKTPQAAPDAARPIYLRAPFLGGAAAIVVAIIAVFFFVRPGDSGTEPEAKAGAANDVAKATGWELGRPGDIVLGSRDAPVKLVEYASLTCPHCASFKIVVFPDIKKKYIDTGLVQYTLREFPTAPAGHAIRAFMLARCTGEERYYQAIEALFRTQALWVRPDPQEARGALEKISRQFGLNDAEFDACINNDEEFQRIRTVAEAGYQVYGIGGTPSFVINGRKAEIRNPSFQALDSAIREHLPEGTEVPEFTPSQANRANAPKTDDDGADDEAGDDADDDANGDDGDAGDGEDGDDAAEGDDDAAEGDDDAAEGDDGAAEDGAAEGDDAEDGGEGGDDDAAGDDGKPSDDDSGDDGAPGQ